MGEAGIRTNWRRAEQAADLSGKKRPDLCIMEAVVKAA